jgi:hypothetical protein
MGAITQLTPKDLAARAEKLAPEKVEAEVLRIVSAKPATRAWRQMLAQAQLLAQQPQLQSPQQQLYYHPAQVVGGGLL